MAIVREVVNFRVKPGHEAKLLEAVRAAKKHFDRLGATFFVVRQVVGPEVPNIVAVSQYSDWNHYAKLRSDGEIAQFLETVRRDTNPPWDSFTVSVSEEVAL